MSRIVLVAALAGWLSGCGRVGYAAPAGDGGPGPTDATPAGDGGALDAGGPDAEDGGGRGDAEVGGDAGPGGPTEGLIVALPLSDDPSDGVGDASGTGVVATCTRCPVLVDGAYVFSGAEYVELAPDPRFETTEGFTISLWVRPERMGLIQTMAAKVYGTGVRNSWQLSHRPGGGCGQRFELETTTGSDSQVIASSEATVVGRWWHVVGTWDGAQRVLYVDGGEADRDAQTTLFDGGRIVIGADWDDGAPDHQFVGAIRDVRLWARALDAAEVASLVEGVTFPPVETPGVGSVRGLVLVDAASDADLGPLREGDTVPVPAGGINVRADVTDGVASVRFGLDAVADYRTESTEPFALEGDTAGDYAAWLPAAGSHTVTATPFCRTGATGAMGTPVRVTFTAE